MPTYPELVNDYRNRLRNNEQSAVDEIQSYYVPLLQKLTKEFEGVVSAIISLQEKNKTVSKSLIYSETRYTAIIQQLVREIRAADERTVTIISSMQSDVAIHAIEDAGNLIKKSMGKIPRRFDFDKAFLRFDQQAAIEMVARLSKGGPLRGILEANVPDVMAASNAFINNIVKGEHPRKLAAQLEKQWGMAYNRAETTARTEVVSAYRDANLWRYRQQSRVVEGWEWCATRDNRTCPVCIYLDGQIFSLDTPFATHPDCRCSPLPVTKTWKELGLDIEEFKPSLGLRGEEWFKDQSDQTQLHILHPEKYKLYKSGQITLEDLTEFFNHPVYGPSREERSIKELKRLDIIQ